MKNIHYYALIFFLFFSFTSLSQTNMTDSLKKVRNDRIQKELVNDTNYVILLLDIAYIYRHTSLDSTIVYCDEALKVSRKIKSVKGEIKSLSFLGNCYLSKNDLSKAAEYFEEALAISREHESFSHEIILLNNLGILRLNQGKFDEALKNYQAVLKRSEEKNDPLMIVTAQINIASVHANMENSEKATDYFYSAMELAKKHNLNEQLINIHGGLSEQYIIKRDYEEALNHLSISLRIAKELNHKDRISLLFNKIGLIYLNMGEHDQSLNYFEKALKINKEIGRGEDARIYVNIARNHFSKGNYYKAVSFAEESLKKSQQSNNLLDLNLAYSILHMSYDKIGDKSSAYKYLLLFTENQDSIIGIDKNKQIAEMEAKYENEKKEQTIELLNKDNELNKALIEKKDIEAKQRNIVIIASFAGLLAFLIFSVLIFRLFIQKKKANSLLEAQNSQIEQKNEELNIQNDEIQKQRNQIEKIHKSLSDSIDYACRIQSSILPETHSLNEAFSENFILYYPKDKVSGDFYWWSTTKNTTVLAAADCTGHGVPGAIMSMLGISFLMEIVNKENFTNPAVILRRLRKEIIYALKQKEKDHNSQDGMDIALISIDHDKKLLRYAGANNPLYIIRKGRFESESSDFVLFDIPLNGHEENEYSFIQLSPDRMPVSNYLKMDKFTCKEILLKEGDCIYMFSDGFADQFGGSEKRKFKYRPFRKLLFDHVDKPFDVQKQIIEKTFNDWKGDNTQVDDVLVMGVKV